MRLQSAKAGWKRQAGERGGERWHPFCPFAPARELQLPLKRQTHLKAAWTFPLCRHFLSVRPQPFLTLKKQKCKTSSFKPLSRPCPPAPCRSVPSTAHAVTTAEQKPTYVMGKSSRHLFSLIFSTYSGGRLLCLLSRQV